MMPLGWRKARPSKVTPRANARSESGSDRRRGVAAGGYWSRLGRGLLISLRVVATVTVLVGGCSGLFVLARELGPLTREWFLVRSVSVNGLHHVTRKEVIGRLALKPDTALYSINPTWLADRVKTHPWIKDATVVLKPLHEIHIDIVEREPAVVVRTVAENLLTDAEGVLLAHLGSSDDPTLPMLSGVDGRRLAQGKVEDRRPVQVGAALARMVGQTTGGRPDINVGNLNNLVVEVQGVTFQFSESSMNQQWSRFLKMRPALRDVAFDGEGARANEIDLRFADRVIVRGRG
ncbi:MAG TPA: FtsQ-type POTRA domain-containing protein [Nitrospira sp.]|jgi:cell division protein FtsQ|nr:FtsQ-type POTRA domain-containing protein [Nitrospira sp.]MCC7473280.1 FtsQ-type POTRA domain-containing protein [Candidatus Nomurabacteria bacterium]MBS0160495.1 FtsQ-type POTRA domain-containing protein [Nitrospira sp.]MBS0179311.1 FtsQ-type POTRA domain-containing protein [Nitrospira sp.]HMZ54347.1 FtsQ-type POTRA domain-containing protein [Nitrospira sp.]